MVAFTQGVLFNPNTPLGVAYPSARLAVQVAWGADLTADPSSWEWSDVTTDVQDRGPVTTTIGTTDEATETPPAKCTFTLGNVDGRYTPDNPLSTHFPHVRRGTPVRVVVTMDGTVAGLRVRFQGRAVGFTPQWQSGYGTCKVVAAGYMQQMQQGKVPVSPMRAACLRTSDKMLPTVYWPLEDGKNATSGLSAVGGQALESVGRLRPGFGEADFAIGSQPLVRLAEGHKLHAPMTLEGTYQRVQFLVQIPKFPQKDGVTDFTLVRVEGNGTIKAWNIDFSAGTAGDPAAVFILRGYRENGTEALGSPRYVIGQDEIPQWISFELAQSGTSINWVLAYCPWGIATDTGREDLYIYPVSGTVTGNIGRTTDVWVAPYEHIDGIGVGHVCGYGSNTLSDIPSGYGSSAIIGHAGDQVDQRINWLIDDRGGFTADMPDAMDTECGPMPIGTTLDVIRDAVRTEGGFLFDGLTDGLTIYGRDRRYDQTAAMTIPLTSVTDGELQPADNDRYTRNRVRATRPAGGEYVAEDTDGPMGINAIGLYDGSTVANPSLERALPKYAQWALHIGMQPGLRWPSVPFNVTATPALAASWLLLTPCDRIDLTGLSAALPGAPRDTITSLVEGWTEVISPVKWTASVNLTPYEPYEVGAVGDGRILDCGASRLASDVTAAATSLPLTIWDSCTWSVSDGSFDIVINGDVMTVTAVGSVTGTYPLRYQTLTVTRSAGARAHEQGDEVHVADPYTVAL